MQIYKTLQANKEPSAIRSTKRKAIQGSRWQLLVLGVYLKIAQYVVPKQVASIVLRKFCTPRKPVFTDKQRAFIATAEKEVLLYRARSQKEPVEQVIYHWPGAGPKIAFAHGWNSKTADFRKLIGAFIAEGFDCYAVDAIAHGLSGGSHTAVPEYADALRMVIEKKGKMEAIIGYSLGGLCSGYMLQELSEQELPRQLTIIAAPSHAGYMFHDLVFKTLKLNKSVYKHLIVQAEAQFGIDIAACDHALNPNLEKIENRMIIHDPADRTVLYNQASRMKTLFPETKLVQAKDMGHNRIIAEDAVVQLLIDEHKHLLR